MATIAEQLTQLTQDRDNLVTNLTTKGITGLTGNETFTELVPEVLNISGGGGTVEAEEKDVNFYDYDGTRLYSYTAQEFANLSAMPENPSQNGLTAQGWNWELSDAKNYVNKYGALEIGQMYVTNDGATRIYVEIKKLKTIYLNFNVIGLLNINWGDGTEYSNSYASTTSFSISHTYSTEGKFTISISGQSYSGNDFSLTLVGDDTVYTKFVWTNQNTLWSTNKLAQASVYKIELGNNVTLGDHALHNFNEIETINLPSHLTSLGKYALGRLFKVKYTVIPKNVVTMGEGALYYNYNSKGVSFPKNANCSATNLCYYNINYSRVCLPEATTTIGDSGFRECEGLKKIIIPDTLTTINTYGMYFCSSLKEADFSGVNSIGTYALGYLSSLEAIEVGTATSYGNYAFRNVQALYIDFSKASSAITITTNTLNNVNATCRLIVPYSLFTTYKTRQYWSSRSAYITGKAKGSDLGNVGSSLPTTDSGGTTLYWYTNPQCEGTAVTQISSADQYYYCKN